MSKNGSIKESILSIYLKENPQIFSNIIGSNIENLTLEQRHAYRNIDIQGLDSKRRIPIYIEVQLNKANKIYLERLKKMMETYNESVVIWIASSFDEDILEEIGEWLKLNKKNYVDFYALSLHDEALTVLEELNEMYHLEIYHNLHQLNELKPLLKIELEIKQIHPTHCGQLNPPASNFDFNRTEDVKRALLQVLRTRIPYFLNFHYDKKTNQYDRILTVGAGRDGLVYRTSAKNVKNLAFVELYFNKSKNNCFEVFKNAKKELSSIIHPDLCFEHRKIGVYFKPADNYQETFEKIAEVFKRMIDGFSPYVYRLKEIPTTSTVLNGKFVQVPMELPEQPFPTEDSFRIMLEEQSEYWLVR